MRCRSFKPIDALVYFHCALLSADQVVGGIRMARDAFNPQVGEGGQGPIRSDGMGGRLSVGLFMRVRSVRPELESFNRLYRLAMGVPHHASTEDILDLDIYNTLDKRVACHLLPQLRNWEKVPSHAKIGERIAGHNSASTSTRPLSAKRQRKFSYHSHFLVK